MSEIVEQSDMSNPSSTPSTTSASSLTAVVEANMIIPNSRNGLLSYSTLVNGLHMNTLFDSGAFMNFMNATLVKQLHLPMQEITLTAIQFGNSSQGSITAVAKVCFNIHGYKDKITFSVIEDLNYGLILGKPWHDQPHY